MLESTSARWRECTLSISQPGRAAGAPAGTEKGEAGEPLFSRPSCTDIGPERASSPAGHQLRSRERSPFGSNGIRGGIRAPKSKKERDSTEGGKEGRENWIDESQHQYFLRYKNPTLKLIWFFPCDAKEHIEPNSRQIYSHKFLSAILVCGNLSDLLNKCLKLDQQEKIKSRRRHTIIFQSVPCVLYLWEEIVCNHHITELYQTMFGE